jgi:hypothetical protein
MKDLKTPVLLKNASLFCPWGVPSNDPVWGVNDYKKI